MKSIANGILVMALSATVPGGLQAGALPLQDAAAAPKRVSMMGAITTIDGNSITLKTDAGAEAVVVAGDDTRVLQALPGQKDLSGATPIHLTDLEVGDRVLARGLPSEDGKSYNASLIVAIKQADIAQKQQHDREEWQTHGVGGLVKAVDPAAGTVTISATVMGVAHVTAIHTAPATITRRYAPDSIEFNAATPAPLSAIKVGDQLRARGTRNADGSELQADEIVSGTFHNVVATVTSIDIAGSTITAKDLVKKVPVVIHITPDSQLRKLPAMMATMIAMRMKGGSAAGGGAGWANRPGGTAAAGTPQPGANRVPDGPGSPGGQGASGSQGVPGGQGTERPRGPGDLQQALTRAPLIKLSDLNKGDAIMVVTTEGSDTAPATAVTLLAGVEPMLQASASGSQSMLQSSWNIGGSGGDAEGQQGGGTGTNTP